MKKVFLIIAIIAVFSISIFSQTLYVPSGTSGISTSTNSGVGIGTTTPTGNFEVANSNGATFSLTTGRSNGSNASPKYLTFDFLGYQNGNRARIRAFDATFNTYRSNLSFFVNDGSGPTALAERLTLLYNGNVGIGTTNPSAKLDILHSGTLGGYFLANKSYLRITDGSNTMLFDPNEIYTNNSMIFGNSFSQNIYFRNVDGSNHEDLMVITYTGKVGIGTTSPASKLFVVGDIGIHQPNNSSAGFIWKNGSYNKISAGIKPVDFGSYARQGIGFFTGDFADKETDAVERMRITRDGNVGIGTTNPGATLDVNGNIRAEKIDVIADVPASDYVFNTDYNLLSLKDLEQFVKTNKHLPEVPSAKEFKENGYSVGEFDDILLRKVEELTLYTISQQKELDKKNQIINELVKSVEELKIKVTQLESK